jgi:hypothetical protein
MAARTCETTSVIHPKGTLHVTSSNLILKCELFSGAASAFAPYRVQSRVSMPALGCFVSARRLRASQTCDG